MLPTPAVPIRGLTLIELLVVLALVVLLAMQGLPAMSGLREASRASASANQIIRAIAIARHQAITTNADVTVCAGSAAGCHGRSDWHRGILIYLDRNHDGIRDANEATLHVLAGWSHDGRMTWRGFRSRPYLRFTRRGYTQWQNGSFTYCPGTNDVRYARRIVLNAAGRTYRAPDRDGDGVDDDPRGRPLRCPLR